MAASERSVQRSIGDPELEEDMALARLCKARNGYLNAPADGLSWGKQDCILADGSEAELFRIDLYIDGFGETFTARIDQCRARQLISDLQEFINAGGKVDGYV